MKAWKFANGEWIEIDDLLVWNEGEDFASALKRAGYYPFPDVTYGDGCYKADLFTKEDGTLPYLIVVSLTSSTIDYIYFYDVPSLMQWLRDYAPIWLLSQVAWQQEELLTLHRRTFRTWHGHDYKRVCPVCDPEEWERLQQARRGRVNRRNTSEGASDEKLV